MSEVLWVGKPRVIFMGSGEIGLPTLHWIAQATALDLVAVITQPDKPVGRSQLLTAPAPKAAAQSYGVRVLQPVKVRRPEALEPIRDLGSRPDYRHGLWTDLAIGAPHDADIACLNLHASLLPRHRGAAPIQPRF